MHNRGRYRRSIRLIIGLLAAGGCATANAELQSPGTPDPGHDRYLLVSRAVGPIVIDGSLNDPVWATAEISSDFWISAQGRAPSEATEVLVLEDASNLYVAFRCYDSRPESLEGRQTRRDARLGYDDQVGIELDPFHNHRDISTYAVNVRGTQSDSIASGRASNIQWKGDWEVATALTNYGWSAEFKIPFAILNYSTNNTEFGVNFLRYHNRTRELSLWADVTPQHKPEEMGQLSSLDIPDHRAEKKWTLKPYLFAGINVPDEQGEVQESSYTMGLDILYEPTPSFAALLTLNPDFSQVEAQVTDIDFSYNEKFLRDPRTFFQEGSAYFGDKEYLYTNRIPDFDYGGKTFGRIGRMQIGFLATEAADDRSDLALRIVGELSDTDSIGLMVVSTDREELTNLLTVVEIDGRRKSGFNYEIDYATSVTDLPNVLRDEKDDAIDASLSWQWDHWTIGSDYSRYGADYLPANGFIRQDLVGTEGVSPFVTYYRDFGDRAISELNLYVTGSDRETWDGRLQTQSWSAGSEIEMRQKVRLGLFHYSGNYRPVAGEPGEFADIVHDDEFWTVSLDFNTRSDVIGYGATHSHGSIAGGDYDNTFAYLWYRPFDSLVLNASSERLQSFGTFNQSILTASWDINSQNLLAARYIWTDDGEFARLAYRRQVRSGLDIFFVFDDGPTYDPEISLKVVWAW